LSGLDRIVEYEPADLTVLVQAGVRVASLQAELGKRGQRLPFDPPLPHLATIGGSLASNALGPLRSAFGGVRDLVIGMKVVHADGAVTKSGGKVVKNVSGYDLMRPHIGAFGTLGVIAEAGFKLSPLPRSARTIGASFASLESAAAATRSLMNSPFVPERLSLLTGPQAAREAASLQARRYDPSGKACLLVATLAGEPGATARMVDETFRACAGADATWKDEIEGVAADRIWAAGEPPSADAPVVTTRTTLKPADCFPFLRQVEESPDPRPLAPNAIAHPAFGTVIVHWRPIGATFEAEQDLQKARAVVGQSRKASARFEVQTVVERCPATLKREIDVWGDIGPSIAIMQSMKTQFDPAGVLNPGRFAGGI
ncbi:MAG: FAD-binding oxidoreductase, partial [Chloroflexi bacterium]|nr:FAD-binding oxidoreductase [Chloroflexota bacterium]